MLLVELLHLSVCQQISLYEYMRSSGDVHVVDTEMGGVLVGCSRGHFGRNCSIAIWNAVQYGLRVPCQHCCSLWVEVISLSPLCGLSDR